ncbi:Uncharacterised protein [uncultured Roseburia sp.]|uniref:Uncharacterized protein n=1 Tax=Brotonthovivens ammoniilytica TaxID=2981725 RepID=A0ABT2TJK0_9FIRM|nr:DUF6751 family protein [Brotonthovivens ammoniilytica]MCU6762282.1 hypothetical protein [Brotonthovivens ammoniilytica]SCI61187.1 Uncharacterised protein [uncultured Roseburia sp.]
MNPNYIFTITLYSCQRAADSPDKKEHWKRTILRNCFWKSETAVTQLGSQAAPNNTYIVRIPINPDYRSYAEWNESMQGFTISNGDLIILGECLEEITGENGHTAAQILKQNKPNAFKVTAFSDNTEFLLGKHYRAGG